jgi:Ring hydroxylating beta subunit
MVMRVLDNIQCPPGLATMRHVPVSSSEGYEIHEYLSMEALFLDHCQYEEWATLLAKDIIYRGPAQLFAPGDAGDSPADVTREYGYEFLVRYARSMKEAAGVPRLRRLITNVIVATGPSLREFAVTSYLVVTGALGTDSEAKFLTVERHDVIRRCSRSYQIARREVGFSPTNREVARLALIV